MANHLGDLSSRLRKLAGTVDQVSSARPLEDAAEVVDSLPCAHDPKSHPAAEIWSTCRWCGVPLQRVWIECPADDLEL